MMRRWIHLALLAALALGISGCASTEPGYYPPPPPPPSHHAEVRVDISLFYDDLAPYGNWYTVEPYGWVWCPRGMRYGWRPYVDGHWIYTDFGWMWASEYSWGWAPFHYGRWAYDSFYGWIWVPGSTWAPAWVAWRYGDGWIGWAPLPPEVAWRVGFGLDFGTFDINAGIESPRWCFVEQRYFLDHRIRTRVLPRSRNVTLFPVTRDVTKYDEIRSRPAERGLDADIVGRALGQVVPRYQLVEAKAPGRGRPEAIRGRTVEIYRPVVPEARPEPRRRIEPPPPEKPAPPQEIEKRQESERRRLENRFERERTALEREQEKELRKPPQGVPNEELRKRHEEEMRAQREIEKRERERLERRQQQQRKDAAERETPAERARPEGHSK